MRKETPRAPKAEKPQRPRFIPCGKEAHGGIMREPAGSSCASGMLVYWATAFDSNGKDIYGKPVRWARRCSCLDRWVSGPRPVSVPPQERERRDWA